MKSAARNRYQRAAHRPGEVRVRRDQVDELLALAASEDDEDRLVGAKLLCACHVRGRSEDIWNAVVGLMTDGDARIRLAAWHTLEDGGVPEEDGLLDRLEGLLARERDPGVRRLAREIIGPVLDERNRLALRHMRRPQTVTKGKCDFCAERGVAVRADLETPIPTDGLSRPALICRSCEAPASARKVSGRQARS